MEIIETTVEAEFAFIAFKTAIQNLDLSKDELKQFLIAQQKNHMTERAILLKHCKFHGITSNEVYVEQGGQNDITYIFGYLDKRIAKAYEEHVRPLVACALKKITSTEKGVLTND